LASVPHAEQVGSPRGHVAEALRRAISAALCEPDETARTSVLLGLIGIRCGFLPGESIDHLQEAQDGAVSA